MTPGSGSRNHPARAPQLAAGAVLLLLCAASTPALAWRSALYPVDWEPGYEDGQGRFLHDFSYAGYHGGEAPIPETPPGAVFDASAAPYLADRSGVADATAAIQHAIDDASAAGGGIVYLPAGTYRVAPPAGKLQALHLHTSGVVLRGDGPDRTFVHNTETVMRDKRVILLSPREAYYTWMWDQRDVRPLAADTDRPTRQVVLGNLTGYATGDWIVLASDATPAWIAEHGMTGTWSESDTSGPLFYRRITAIDPGTGTLTLDAPTRYPLKVRDQARIAHVLPHLEEVGVERLSIGMEQNRRAGTGTNDYAVEGTGAWEMHASAAVYFNHVVDGWMRDVHSYRPASNSANVHLLSMGVRLDFSRHITLQRLDLRNAQYQGAGGNGYLFVLTGNDCLVTDTVASGGRHNYSFAFTWSSGNVIHRSSTSDGRLPVDFHQRLAIANLLDNLTVERDVLEGAFRDCCGHGQAATESVFWNTHGLQYPTDQWLTKFIVDSQQFGWGYVIGTRGAANLVRARSGDGTEPLDLVEGVGQGDSLEPHSLYEDQLARRLGLTPPDPPDPPDPAQNQAPVVDAGADAALSFSDPVLQLAGVVQDDGLPNPPAAVTSTWSLLLGPDLVALDDDHTPTTRAHFRAPGVYELRLVADDGALQAQDVVTITVLELPVVCGNGLRELGEQCDGLDLAGASCGGLGYAAGSLRCADDCLGWVADGCRDCVDPAGCAAEPPCVGAACAEDAAGDLGDDVGEPARDGVTMPGDCGCRVAPAVAPKPGPLPWLSLGIVAMLRRRR